MRICALTAIRGAAGFALLAGLVAAGGAGIGAAAAVEGWELTSSDVRAAYFLGQRRGDQRLAEFLAAYVKSLPAPASGPHVAAIGFATPYQQVVERSRQMVAGYSSQQAERDYAANRGRLMVTVRVSLSPSDVTTLRDAGFWNEFDVRLVQDERIIEAHGIKGELVYSGDGGSQIIGFDLRAEFSTSQVSRGAVRVEVTTHEKKVVKAEFDLRALK